MLTKLPMAILLGALALGLCAPRPALAQTTSPEIQAIVADTRPSAELSDKELRQRMQALKDALDQPDIAEATRKELRGLLRADRTEQQTRGNANAAGEADAPPAETATDSGGATEQPAEPGAAAEAVGGGSEAATIESVVSSTQPSDGLSDDALQGRLAEIEAGLARGELPRALRSALKTMQKADQAELERRRQAVVLEQPAADTSSASQAQSEEPAAAEEPAATASDSGNATSDARQLLLSSRNLGKLSEPDLRARLADARRLNADKSLPGNLRVKLTDLSGKLRTEIRRRGIATAATSGDDGGTVIKPKKKNSQATAAASGGDVTVTTKRKTAGGTSAADRQALKLINDTKRPDRLPRDELRRRLETYRVLLASGELSPKVETELRAKLKRERSLLRERVAVEEVQATGSTTSTRRKDRVVRKVAVPEPTVSEAPKLATDKRRATELNERQLNRRILAYRVLNRSDSVSSADRSAYRERVRADRAELRRRLLEDKRRRVVEVRKAPRLVVNVDLGNDAGVTLWAAEAGDEEIERQLTARPVRRIRERYPRRIILENPEHIVTNEEVRESLPSVELDTINFGFNESFVGEEEIADLDQIGTILERILASNPDEVFLIEGHTDAVGSDGYNLKLSLERARAVKAALIDYYAISPDNVSVVGLGERYLKIPTLEPDEENRRVTVRRMTSLLSDYDPY